MVLESQNPFLGFVSTPEGREWRGLGTEFWENTEKSVVCSPEAGQTPTQERALSLGAVGCDSRYLPEKEAWQR